jgi:NitT/TauT family transport system permease protein
MITAFFIPNYMKKLFKLRGKLPSRTITIIELAGAALLLMSWQLLVSFGHIPHSILPTPTDVLKAFPELHFNDYLIANTIQSVKLNMLGYLEAVVIALPLGLIIGLFPVFNALSRKYIDAARFIPLTAVTGLFIAWFGIDINMKIQFLAFGIAIYLLPVVMQRVSEVEKVYEQTAYTLGASKWQMIKTVFIPKVMSSISDDIRVLVAISWTYIIVAEMMNSSGGIGSMIFLSARQGRLDKVFAMLIVIVLIGFVQDKTFIWLDKKFFPHKHLQR